MTMAGKRPEIHLTQTNDIGRLLTTIGNKLPITGFIDLPRTIKIAQLSLKHRQNKNQKQRIIAFVGSPIEGLEENDFVKLGKQLRKNDVALDVINFGHPENIPSLTQLVDNCSKGGNSHLVDINYGSNICDVIITSPVVAYDTGYDNMQVDGADGASAAPGGGAPAAPGGGQFAEYGGIDPNLDPELAMAIRISLEEAKYEGNKDGDAPASSEAPEGTTAQEQPPKTGDAEMKEDAAAPEVPAEDQQPDMEEDEDYDEDLEAAKLLSLQGAVPEDTKEEPENKAEVEVEVDNEGMIDEEFIGEIMNDLGVDMTENAVQSVLNNEDGDKKEDAEEKDKKDEDKKE